jgi:hypothetical protein
MKGSIFGSVLRLEARNVLFGKSKYPSYFPYILLIKNERLRSAKNERKPLSERCLLKSFLGGLYFIKFRATEYCCGKSKPWEEEMPNYALNIDVLIGYMHRVT